jgi:hypothetical protein
MLAQVLKHIWFKKLADTDDHQARLEAFYGPQAQAYDSFRSKFLWGRKPMLAACAARLEGQDGLVWVDLGGGTGENVALMAKYIDLSRFKKIYVVDLTPSLCAQVRRRTARTPAHQPCAWAACQWPADRPLADLTCTAGTAQGGRSGVDQRHRGRRRRLPVGTARGSHRQPGHLLLLPVE